ncbi:hypothetical protein G5714_007348 [Onychostoma macrolepis]|uniref:Uncharacterized protein n=1 Tax=Onychostoma macrolepis TaxID=369639 RepID=A0A7J6D023_9TELE|nr:hypothetical protein G5714_007348 [Onychostoma macrolepis]
MAAIVEMDDLSGQDLYQKRPRPVGVSMVAAVLLFPLLLKENQRSLHVISEEPHTPNPVLFIKGRALDAESLLEIMMEGEEV